MDRRKFFEVLRSRAVPIFGTALSSRQVQGIEAILDAGERLPLSHLGHVLGEGHHETGGGMYPIKETVFRSHKDQNPSDQEVIRRLDSAWAKGQLPWVRAAYWRDGFFGRGQIQLTHRSNYQKIGSILGIDLAAQPQLALDPGISGRIAVVGCEKGLFTGKKLADYDLPGGGYDHRNARRIVNGYVASQASDVASRAASFELALREAGYAPSNRPFVVSIPDLGPKTALGGMSSLKDLATAILATFRRS